ncbi:hypothetical protein BJX63DRAFT_396151 [Aspergillus granulosus]|uniref:Uncharacterized protein n=1 Tax=Aspergillus granulosus TaxID=176169 RepID=A0ABR4HCU5_9EURO
MCNIWVVTTRYTCGHTIERREPHPCPENHPQPWPERFMGSSRNRQRSCPTCAGVPNGN